MKLIRKFGTLFTLLAALSVTTWSAGCGQKTETKKKGTTPAAKGASDTKKGNTGSKDGQPKTSQVTIPGTVDDNPDGVGSGTGAGIKLDDLDN